MKTTTSLIAALIRIVPGLATLLLYEICGAADLPVITDHPLSRIVKPGTAATFSVSATGATAYQWRFNGNNITGATASSYQIASAAAPNVGYYMVVVKNAGGWVPSRLAYLSVVGTGGTVPFSNQYGPRADYQGVGTPIASGSASVVAGPELDRMRRLGTTSPVVNGYYDGPTLIVGNVAPGQTVYYRVDITYTVYSGTYTQQSTVLQLTAGGDAWPVPSASALKFPVWPEWPEPVYWDQYSSPANIVKTPGSSLSLSNYCFGYQDFGIPTLQWRKDGRAITSPMSFIGSPPTRYSSTLLLQLTSLQAEDAGTYDAVVIGNDWFITKPITLSIQFTEAPGILRSPRISHGTNFICDLEGVAGLKYGIQASTNLVNWTDLLTLSNASGIVIFSNALPAGGQQYFRALSVQ